MREYKILIPILRNGDNKPHCSLIWGSFGRDLASAFGGYTREANPVSGEWVDNSSGRVVADLSQVYYVAIPDTSEAETHLFAILIDYRQRFDQQCLYVVETSVNARLI